MASHGLRNSARYLKTLLLVLMVLNLSAACAPGTSLRSEPASPAELTGTYTLYLFGGRHHDDIETVALFDLENDPYVLDIYSSDFNYRVQKKLDAAKALSIARQFVQSQADYVGSIFSKILDAQGTVIAYELRPLYQSITYGISNVIDVHYYLSGQKVTVYIKLKPMVERMISSGDGGGSGKDQ